jgi:hypothetical protein
VTVLLIALKEAELLPAGILIVAGTVSAGLFVLNVTVAGVDKAAETEQLLACPLTNVVGEH